MQEKKVQKQDPLIEAYHHLGEEISYLKPCKIINDLTYLHSLAIGEAVAIQEQIAASTHTVLQLAGLLSKIQIAYDQGIDEYLDENGL